MKQMLKKIGLPALVLLAALLMIAPTQAKAGVHFGISIGPTYAYPAYPYAYSYPNNYYGTPYYNGYAPGVYPPAVYSAPYVGVGIYGRDRYDYGWRDHDRHEYREHGRGEYRRDRR